MHKYCKAYKLQDLRQFPAWVETQDATVQRSDEDICYIWDDFTVVSSPIKNDSLIFDAVTPEWQTFCTDVLQFAIPEDLRFAYAESSVETSAEN